MFSFWCIISTRNKGSLIYIFIILQIKYNRIVLTERSLIIVPKEEL
jgi:hypothetical protein